MLRTLYSLGEGEGYRNVKGETTSQPVIAPNDGRFMEVRIREMPQDVLKSLAERDRTVDLLNAISKASSHRQTSNPQPSTVRIDGSGVAISDIPQKRVKESL